MRPRTVREHIEAMTTSEAASALGVSCSTASLIRSGDRCVTLRRLAIFVANVGDSEIDYLATIRQERAIAELLSERRRGET